MSRLIYLVLSSLLVTAAAPVCAELPAEPVPNVLKLDTPYPASYAVVHDFAFGGLIDSKFALVDIASGRFKGMMSAGQFANIDFSVPRQKFYVGETVHTRGSRGKRQDLVTIYDFANLDVVKEIELPPKRMNVVVNLSASVITDDDRFLLVFNMNPGTSVSVIDLDSETMVNEIPMPGCTLLYPDAHGGFFSLCGNGGLVHVEIDEQGKEVSRWSSEVFNDIDKDSLSEKATRIGNVWYFVTYAGEVQPVDVSNKRPVVGERWWLTSEAERKSGFRPAGWHGKGSHPQGQLWIAMTPQGYNGSHKDPATEVWRVDPAKQKVLKRMQLKVPALSIGVSRGAEGSLATARLLAVNIEGSLDVYAAEDGEFLLDIRALGDTPYIVQAVE